MQWAWIDFQDSLLSKYLVAKSDSSLMITVNMEEIISFYYQFLQDHKIEEHCFHTVVAALSSTILLLAVVLGDSPVTTFQTSDRFWVSNTMIMIYGGIFVYLSKRSNTYPI